jgi:alginate O-acetyltransferase complex protein AlgI
MLFNSAAFLQFLAISLPLYYLLPPSKRPLALLAASYIFYGLWSVPYLTLLAAVSAAAWIGGLSIEQARSEQARKVRLIAALTLLLGPLFFFKYPQIPGSASLFERSLVPLGISYYTFKLVSYVVDVYWEKIKAEKNPLAIALYAAFFPQILSGPIQRAEEFFAQMRAPIQNKPERIASGLRLMLFGYFKKVVVADSLAPFVNGVFLAPSDHNSACVLLACYAFVWQLYADFSGFTDIAIGTGRLFGIESPKNFNMPFYSRNIQELWRSWHITLTKWLADYVFMPLRMTFRDLGKLGIAAAITVNFIAIGLWHDATLPFLMFGSLHAFYMIVSVNTLSRRDAFFLRHPRLAALRSWWAPVLTFQLWTIGEILFFSSSLEQAAQIFSSLAAMDLSGRWFSDFTPRQTAMRVASILIMEFAHWAQAKKKIETLFCSRPAAIRWTVYFLCTIMILHRSAQGYIESIYFKF